MSLRKLPVPFALLLAALALLPACGGSDEPIPAASARALVRYLDAVEQRVRAGECRQARATLRRLDRTAAALPEGVEPSVRTTLSGGVDRLAGLVQAECRQKRPKPVVQEEPEPIAPPVDTTPEPAPEPAPEPEPEEPPAEEKPKQEPTDEQPPKDDSGDDKPKGDEEPKPDDSKGGVPNPCPPGSPGTC
jgi:outer membrane biosynthesis protein TonB